MKEKTEANIVIVAFWLFLILGWGVFIIGVRDIIVLKRNYHFSAKFIDTKTVSVADQPATKVYIRTEKHYFYPGDIVTSKENGALILWDSLTMSRNVIVGIVSDSGTIEKYQP